MYRDMFVIIMQKNSFKIYFDIMNKNTTFLLFIFNAKQAHQYINILAENLVTIL